MMEIIVKVKESELEEMNVTREELKTLVITDLNNNVGDYFGFNVTVSVEVGA